MPQTKPRHIASLDGLRAFAVLAVLAYHMDYTWAPGGLLGVTVFFVLSGFLITNLLINEFRSAKTVSLSKFWLRRARRLAPAIVAVIVVVCAACVLFNHVLLTKMRPDIAPSLFFYSNWWQIFHQVSYFEAQGPPSPLQHFWSLAIEEQFYLLWPVLLLFLFKRRTRFRSIRRGVALAVLASALAMALLYQADSDPSRVYFGTDTRAFSLLIGAWLAFAWPSSALCAPSRAASAFRPQLGPSARRLLDVLGLLAFLGIVALVVFSKGYTAFAFRGGILLCSVLTALVIAAIVHPASLFAKFWALPPLTWIGKRSYGLYLWHFPLLLLMSDPNASESTPLWLDALKIAVVVVAAALSYAFIENPVRQGRLGAWVDRVRSASPDRPRASARHGIPLAFCGAALALAVVGGIAVPPTSAVGSAGEADAQAAQTQAQEAAAQAAEQHAVYNPLMIGDSISESCEDRFAAYFPQGFLDAGIGRRLSQGQELYDHYRDLGLVGQTVVLALGTNSLVTSDQLDAVIKDIGPEKRIVFVNTRSKEKWVDDTNKALAEASNRYDNVDLVNWHSASSGKSTLFVGDGKHLSDEGIEAYLALIKKSIDTER